MKNDLFSSTKAIISQRAQIRPPSSLYHFTDAAGLLGICTSKTLRLHLVGASNDASEGRYAIDLAREVAASMNFPTDEYHKALRDHLEDAQHHGTARIAIDHYIACFCEKQDSALHWLHYGRMGTGYALAVSPSDLNPSPFVLVKVLYRPDDQKELLQQLFQTIHDVFDRYLVYAATSDRPTWWMQAGKFAAEQARLFQSQFKQQAFEQEDEWRVVTLDTPDKSIRPETDVAIPLDFIHRASKVVPFIPMPLATSAFAGVVCGFSSAHANDTKAIGILTEAKLGHKLPIETSKVPVRP